MNHWLKKLGLAATLLGATILPTFAGDASPAGSWQTTTGETRVKVTMCGDGTQLCATLTWLRDDARTEENLAYLNKRVVNAARQTRDNAWKGTVHFNGQSATGTIKLVGEDTITLSGCKLGMCKSFQFVRI